MAETSIVTATRLKLPHDAPEGADEVRIALLDPSFRHGFKLHPRLGRIPGNTQRRAYSRAHSVTSGAGLRNSSASVTSPTSRGRRSRPNVSNRRRKCEVARP